MSEALAARAAEYLAAHHVMTLATTGGDGPWAAAVFYASAGFELYFLSAARTRHCRNLAADPRAAATIQDDHRDWRDIRGLQIAGTVEELDGRAREAARRQYATKFPFLRAEAALPTAIVEALARVRWYRLCPTEILMVDNTVRFGHRERIPGPY